MQQNYTGAVQDTPLRALSLAVAETPNSVFVDMVGELLTFAELDRKSTRLANSLAALGVSKGRTVVTIMESNLDVFVCWFGINKLGAIWVPINLAYRHEFLRHQISDSAANIVVCDPEYLERVVEIADQLPSVDLILVRNLSEVPECSIPIEPFDTYRGDDDTPLSIEVLPSDLAFLIYTSGTTGPSKGCMLSHNLLCHLGRQQIAAIPHTMTDRTFTPLPLFHMSALTAAMGGLIARNGVAIWPRFSVSRFWDDIERSQATSALLMASIFPLVAHSPDTEAMKRCHGQLRMIAGVPVSPDVRKIWESRFGVEIVNTYSYGQTEGCRISTWELGEPQPALGSAGRIANEFEVIIVDDDDMPVGEGEVGEIVYRPRQPHVMFEGYWRRPEDTVRAFRNMWMHTGDLGRIVDGNLFFSDRKKDYLRSRGENISSFEVEKTYAAHPDVVEVAVHAVGEKAADDQIKVTIVLCEDAKLTAEECCRWSIDNLPHFAVPRFYEFRTELPKNPTGRILKYQLRDEGVTAITWDSEAHGMGARRSRR